MNEMQIRARLENAESTKFKIGYCIIGDWNDVIAEISCLTRGDQDSFVIINGELAGKTLSYCDGEFEIN